MKILRTVAVLLCLVLVSCSPSNGNYTEHLIGEYFFSDFGGPLRIIASKNPDNKGSGVPATVLKYRTYRHWVLATQVDSEKARPSPAASDIHFWLINSVTHQTYGPSKRGEMLEVMARHEIPESVLKLLEP